MSTNANELSPTDRTSTARTTTHSRRSARPNGAEAAPNKLQRHRSGHAQQKDAADAAAAPEPVTAVPRGTIARTAATAPAATAANGTAKTTTKSAKAKGRTPMASTTGRPSTEQPRSSTRVSPSTGRRSTSRAAATVGASTARQAPRRSPAPATTRSATTPTAGTRSGSRPPTTAAGGKTSQHHVLQADDPVFMQMRHQRRASSTGSAVSASVFPADQRFELLATFEPVPELPEGLEKELVRQYTENLLHLPLRDVERVVGAICHDADCKLVMTYMKGEQLRLKAEARRERPVSVPPGGSTTRRTGTSGTATVVSPATTKTKRSKKTTKHAEASAPAATEPKPAWVKTVRVGETTAEASQRARSGRITSRPASSSIMTSRRRGAANAMTPAAQEAALKRFNAAFSNEVRYVFLEDAGHLCHSRRLRFYHEQPAIVREKNIAIPDEVLRPVYGQVVNKLLFRTLGWSEQECKLYTPAVVDIVIAQLNGSQEAEEGDDSPMRITQGN